MERLELETYNVTNILFKKEESKLLILLETCHCFQSIIGPE